MEKCTRGGGIKIRKTSDSVLCCQANGIEKSDLESLQFFRGEVVPGVFPAPKRPLVLSTPLPQIRWQSSPRCRVILCCECIGAKFGERGCCMGGACFERHGFMDRVFSKHSENRGAPAQEFVSSKRV